MNADLALGATVGEAATETIGGTVTAAHGKDPLQTFTFTGHWGKGEHAIQIEGINMRYGISLQAGRLFVDSINLDGAEVSGRSLMNTGLGDINQFSTKLNATLEGRDIVPPEPPAPVMPTAAPQGQVMMDSRENRAVVSSEAEAPASASQAGPRGAGANAGSGAADDVFDLTLSGPAALADTPPDAPLFSVMEVATILPMASSASEYHAICPNTSSRTARCPKPTSRPPDRYTIPPTSAPPSHGSSGAGTRIRCTSRPTPK